MPFQHAKLLAVTKSMPPTSMRRSRDIIHKTPIGQKVLKFTIKKYGVYPFILFTVRVLSFLCWRVATDLESSKGDPTSSDDGSTRSSMVQPLRDSS